MQKENQNTSHHDVMPAVAKFIGDRTFEGAVEELPVDMQEIADLFLQTQFANDLHMREKLIRCLNLIREFSRTLQPFSNEQVYEACKEQGYV